MAQAASEQSGAMAAILGLDEEAVVAICAEATAEVCNVNAPGQVVIGGRTGAVDAAMALALERGAQRGVKLRVSGAFHTSLMRPAAEGMSKAVEATPVSDTTTSVIANTTAQPIRAAADLRRELVDQLVTTVQWSRSMETLTRLGVDSVIEFGPGRVLTGLMKRINRSLAVRNVSDMASASATAVAPTPP